MSESTQIVRPLGRGEFLPDYSTAHLLMSSVSDVSEKAPDMTLAEKQEKFRSNYSLIKDLLARFESNEEIARAVGLPVRFIRDRIRSTAELVSLSDARLANVVKKGGAAGIKKSRDRFAKQKNEILRALEKEAMYKVALRFKFSQRTLRIYVDEVKNGK